MLADQPVDVPGRRRASAASPLGGDSGEDDAHKPDEGDHGVCSVGVLPFPAKRLPVLRHLGQFAVARLAGKVQVKTIVRLSTNDNAPIAARAAASRRRLEGDF